jgi:hypothetical protein
VRQQPNQRVALLEGRLRDRLLVDGFATFPVLFDDRLLVEQQAGAAWACKEQEQGEQPKGSPEQRGRNQRNRSSGPRDSRA